MATGSGKTFTAVSSIYRLIKFGGARRVLFLVDRSNLGRQTLKEFQQYVTPDDGRKFTELYNVQRLTSNALDPVCRVIITTIQRLYSILCGEPDLPPELEERSWFDMEDALSQPPKVVKYNPRLPIEFFDADLHRRVPPLDLPPLAAGAGVLRRPPDRPDRHAVETDARLLQRQPGDGVPAHAGCRRWGQRGRPGLPHPHADHRARQHGRRRLFRGQARPADPRGALGAVGRGLRLHRHPARPRRGRREPDPHRDPHVPRQALHRPLPRPDGGPQDAGLRQGRQPRRGHRADHPGGVRQGERVLPEDHLPRDGRGRRRPDRRLPQLLPPAHRGHRGHDLHRHRHQAAGDPAVHAAGEVARAVRADAGPRHARDQRHRPAGRDARCAHQDAFRHRGCRGRGGAGEGRHADAGAEADGAVRQAAGVGGLGRARRRHADLAGRPAGAPGAGVDRGRPGRDRGPDRRPDVARPGEHAPGCRRP